RSLLSHPTGAPPDLLSFPTRRSSDLYHLDLIPNAVDLGTWRLNVEGNVERPLQLGFEELVKNFKAVSVAAVNQCSGNSRSRFQPDRKSTRLNSSHDQISYAVFCLKKK